MAKVSASEEIDVVALNAGLIQGMAGNEQWNAWLRRCRHYGLLDDLMKVRRGIQKGMDSAVKKKLVDENLAIMFTRWIGSIDKTVRRVIKERNPMANDFVNNPHANADTLKKKQIRDAQIEEFLRKNSY